MMNLDFEDYITGDLPAEESQAVEKRVAEIPALRAQMQKEQELLRTNVV